LQHLIETVFVVNRDTHARFIAYDSASHMPPANDPVWPLIERDVQAFLSLHAR
jgi:hypothetical protein